MALLPKIIMTTSALLVASSLPSFAADKLTIAGKARVGAEYQSNVTVSALEQASGQADSAILLEAELNASWQATTKLKFDSGYSIQDKNYRDADDFDNRLQLAYVDASYQLGKHTVGSNIYHATASLNNASLLNLNQISVYSLLSGADTWFIRPSVTFAEKTFARNEERDATTLTAATDAFWFFNAGLRFVSVGLVWEDEHSRDNSFSYTAPGIRLKVVNQVTFWQYQHQFQLGAKFSQRQYQAATPTEPRQPPRRSDTHAAIEASWQLDLNPHFAVIAKVEHGDYASTLDSADYQETRTGLLLQLGF